MPVALRIIRFRPEVFDHVPDERAMNLFVDERGLVVTHDFIRDSKAAHQIFSNKIGNDSTGSVP